MRQVRFAGGAKLSLMLLRREDVGATNELEIVAWMAFLDALEDILQSDHVPRLYKKKPSVFRKPEARSPKSEMTQGHFETPDSWLLDIKDRRPGSAKSTVGCPVRFLWPRQPSSP